MRRLVANKYVLALLVVIAVAAEFGLASLSHHPAALASGPRAPAPARATVSAVLRACPGPGSSGATASGLALAADSSGSGQATVTRLSPAGAAAAPAPLHVFTQPGLLSLVNVATAPALPRSGLAQASTSSVPVPTGPARGGVTISATGSMARGLEVEQTSAGGLATAQCLGPGTDFWFVGPGQKSAADIELYLMNTDGVAADASVQVLTDSGPVLGSSDAGIGVPPHGMVVQSLAGLVRGSRVVALNVTTSVGRVVPAVQETSGAGQPGAWLPAAQTPATTQVLPGLPATPGGRNLYVAVPGSGNAQVKVTAITARGSYQPTGGSGIDLPGGSAVSVALPSLGGIPAAIEVSSSVPVTATMGLTGGAAGAPGAFTAAAAPVQEQGVIAGNPAGGGTTALVLSAPGRAAQVQVTELTSAGQAGSPASQTVQLAAGHSQVVTLTPPRQGGRPSAFAVVVTPMAGSGPVYAGRVVTEAGVVRSILPVTSSLTWVPLPAVRNSLSTALP